MKKETGIAFISLYAFIIFIIYFFMRGNSNYGLFVNLITFFTPIIALYFGFLALFYFKITNTQGKSLFFFTITIGLWWIGDFIWWFVASNEVVSIADFFWLLAYMTLIIAVYYGVKVIIPDFSFKSQKKVMILFFVLFAAVSIAYLKIFPMSWNFDVSIIENIVTSGYIIADLLLLLSAMFILVLIYLIRKGSYSRVWILIAIAIFLFLVGDFYYLVNVDTYKGGNPIDLAWELSYLFYALSFIVLKDNAEKTIESIKTESQEKKNQH